MLRDALSRVSAGDLEDGQLDWVFEQFDQRAAAGLVDNDELRALDTTTQAKLERLAGSYSTGSSSLTEGSLWNIMSQRGTTNAGNIVLDLAQNTETQVNTILQKAGISAPIGQVFDSDGDRIGDGSISDGDQNSDSGSEGGSGGVGVNLKTVALGVAAVGAVVIGFGGGR